MQTEYGASCVPLVLNGCCGDLNPWDPFDPDFRMGHENVRRMGAELTDMACRVLRTLKFSDSGTLDWRVRRVPLQYRDIPEARQAEVDRILTEDPTPKWIDEEPKRIDPAWFRAALTKSIEYCRRRSPEFPYEIQAFRVGDTAFIGLPGEPFVEGQLAIKIGSATYPTYVAHCVSHYVGYLPTKDAYTRGGHEANPDYTYWAKLAPGSLETVVENAVDMVGELFA